MSFSLTFVSLIAFSANAILCRFALRGGLIDAAGFTAVRLLSGAAALLVLSLAAGRKPFSVRETKTPLALFGYAVLFSYAYLRLEAAAGALIIFSAVKITMVAVGFAQGERLTAREAVGIALAVGGLVYLLLPGLSAPPLLPALLMFGAGVSWGFFSLWGRSGGDPVARTAWNFMLASPLALATVALDHGNLHLTSRGALFAATSGAVTSGVGYVIWYAALRHLTAIRAAVVQLIVPVMTAAAAVWLLHEAATPRLLISAAMVLGGLALVSLP